MRVINTISTVVSLVCFLSLFAYWTNRIITLPDATQLATKQDIKAVTAIVVDRSLNEEKKQRAVAEEDKRRHDDLMKKLHVAMVRQQENIKAINALKARLRRYEN